MYCDCPAALCRRFLPRLLQIVRMGGQTRRHIAFKTVHSLGKTRFQAACQLRNTPNRTVSPLIDTDGQAFCYIAAIAFKHTAG